jgi:endonuclease/exonuclease/phosphatase family metal-dependent hydrolase
MELERERQALAINELVRRLGDPEGFPAVVAGDFDAAPDRSSIRFMTGRQSLEGTSTHFWDAWEIAGDGPPDAGFTWSIDNPLVVPITERWSTGSRHRRRIDYIFVGSTFQFRRKARIASCRVVLNKPANGMYPSDHFGVMAEIDAVE